LAHEDKAPRSFRPPRTRRSRAVARAAPVLVPVPDDPDDTTSVSLAPVERLATRLIQAAEGL
jgi:hypothetical protein